jgi:hypothetical protein
VLSVNVPIVNVLIRAQAGHGHGFKVWQQQGIVLQHSLRGAAFRTCRNVSGHRVQDQIARIGMLFAAEIAVAMNGPQIEACALVQRGEWQLIARLMRIARHAIVYIDAESS